MLQFPKMLSLPFSQFPWLPRGKRAKERESRSVKGVETPEKFARKDGRERTERRRKRRNNLSRRRKYSWKPGLEGEGGRGVILLRVVSVVDDA